MKDNILQGIPTPADAGQLYLEITAHGANSKATVTCTVFVRDVPTHTSGAPLRFKTSGPEFVRCKQTESETVATMIVDADIEAMSVTDRMALLKKFISHMNLHEDMVKMMPIGNTPVHDSSALVSGTGDSSAPKTSGLFISWPVGCGQVKEGHFPVLQRLDDDSGNGKMAKVLGFPVIGWQVTNSHFKAPTRRRRQIQATPTPTATPIMPTKTESKQDMTEDKMTHMLVDNESPVFIQPTVVQPPMTKTDEPVVYPPVKEDEKPAKVMPTEATLSAVSVSKTEEMPLIKPTKTRDSPEATEVPTSDGCLPNQKPEVKTPLRSFRYKAGVVIDYVIPEDTFKDCKGGGARGLDLRLYKNKTHSLEPGDFLQFDERNQKIIGLPMNENAGTHNFTLIGRVKDRSLLASNDFTIHIDKTKKKNINHELSVTVDYDYDQFVKDVTNRIRLADSVASVYGDPNSTNLLINRFERGSVVVVWANESLTSDDCPSGEITKLVRKLVNEDGTLSEHAIEKMKPFYLLSAAAAPSGACKGDPNFPTTVSKPRTTAPPAEDKEDGDKDEDGRETDDSKSTEKPDDSTVQDVAKGSKGDDDDDDGNDMWITTVVPAVVIVVILLIALIIACILYRKKRKGKMNVEEQNTFINKGAPVIFPDELEDKPSDVNKPLLVEGSPAPPPEYHRGTSESPERLATSDNRNIPADDRITEIPEKPYEPPPPVTVSGSSKQPRPTQQQQPFSQAPQILP